MICKKCAEAVDTGKGEHCAEGPTPSCTCQHRTK